MSTFADLRFAFRQMRRAPGVALTAVLSVGLGMGASTAIFSVVYGVVIDPFPYRDVDTLMSIRLSTPDRPGFRTGYTVSQFLEFRDRSTVFDGLTASTISDVLWTGREYPERLRGNHTTYDGLEIMGVPAMIGRIFTKKDRREDVAVLGFRFWQRQFGGDTGIVGQRLLLNGKSRTVLGVMPPRFMWRGADVYIPLEFERGVKTEGVEFVHVVGRLKPGVTEPQASADLRPIIEELRTKNPTDFPPRFNVGLLSFADTFPSGITNVLWVLLGAVGLLLVIACANVSNLLLAQAARRSKEMAIRTSLGAGRGRMIRQLLTESLVIAIAGGFLGILLAWIGTKGILAMVPPFTIPDEAEVRLSWPVLGFAGIVSMATTILFGLLPAWQATRKDVVNPMKEGGRTGASRQQGWLAGGLVVAEAGLSLMLLIAASVMVRSMIAVTSTDYGINAQGVLVSRIPVSVDRYPTIEQRALLAQRLVEKIESMPGIEAAAVNTNVHPFGNMSAVIEVPGAPEGQRALVHSVSSGYWKIFRIGLRAGRVFNEAEMTGRRQVAIVSESFAQKYLPGRNALGGLFRVPQVKQPPIGLANDGFEVIGVVANTGNAFPREPMPEIYVPFSLTARPNFGLLARARSGDGRNLAALMRRVVTEVDKDQPVSDGETVESMIARFLQAGPKFNVVLFGVFAALGLTLVIVGLHGVISNSVSRRTQEIGIRMALGASSGAILRQVVGQAAKLMGLGLGLGIIGGLWTGRYLAALVTGTTPYDAWSIAAVTLLLAAFGLLASWIPARRAARVDPVRALRSE